jgi:hypothetical protein
MCTEVYFSVITVQTGAPTIEFTERTENDKRFFTAVLKSIPTPIHAEWRVKNKGSDEWTPIDVNSEKYRGSTNSLPQPVLVVTTKEEIRCHSVQIVVRNFIGSSERELPGMAHNIREF